VANTDNFIESKPKAEVSLNQPPRCPKCRSTETSSAAKRPTANSYWRCLKCGDVWNPALLSEPKRWWQR
jgi:ribosomal protein L37AE/L43A